MSSRESGRKATEKSNGDKASNNTINLKGYSSSKLRALDETRSLHNQDKKYSTKKRKEPNKKLLRAIVVSGIFILAVLLLFFIIKMAIRKTGSEVFVGDEKICIVNNSSITEDYITKTVTLLIANEYGSNVLINEKIKATPVRAKKDEMLTENAMILKVKEKVTYKVEGAAFIVDSAVVTVLSNMDEANKLKENIMNEYIPEGSSIVIDECSFVENVLIETRYVDPGDIKTYDEALLRLTEGAKGQKPYTIVSGDFLSKIAQKNSTTVEKILELNPDINVDTVLKIGQKINVESYTPFLSVKTVENTYYIEKQPKETQYQYDNTKPASYKKVIQQGKDGQRKVTVQIIRVNGFEEETKIISTETTEEPVTEIILAGTQ